MKEYELKYDFNDILIVPKKNTHIVSRYTDISIPNILPLFTAPMDTVVDLTNIDSFLFQKINVVLPRTVKYGDFKKKFDNNQQKYQNVFTSFGLLDLERYAADNFKIFHQNAHIVIDVANGHMQRVIDLAKEIKESRPDIIIMIGNIANPESYLWYAENDCVDYIRVGIGSGSGCLTSKQSSIGYPMASLIHEIYNIKQEFIKNNENDKKYQHSLLQTKPTKIIPSIIADGGIKGYSDIIKALALGADYVMIGSLFNKALESCAKNYLYGIGLNKDLANYLFNKKFPIKKFFRGMSTKGAQKAMGKTSLKTSEGVVRFREVEYHLNTWIENFEHYLRSAMSYCGAQTLNDFIGNVNICHITKNAYDRFNK